MPKVKKTKTKVRTDPLSRPAEPEQRNDTENHESENSTNPTKTLSANEAKSYILELENLKKSIICKVCSSVPIKAMMCPTCSHLCCCSCLQRWYRVLRNPTCPHCSETTPLDDFVASPWASSVNEICKGVSNSDWFPVREMTPEELTLEYAAKENKEEETLDEICRKVSEHLKDKNINSTMSPVDRSKLIPEIFKRMLKIGEYVLDSSVPLIMRVIEKELRSIQNVPVQVPVVPVQVVIPVQDVVDAAGGDGENVLQNVTFENRKVQTAV